jgi:hypothetical protein
MSACCGGRLAWLYKTRSDACLIDAEVRCMVTRVIDVRGYELSLQKLNPCGAPPKIESPGDVSG